MANITRFKTFNELTPKAEIPGVCKQNIPGRSGLASGQVLSAFVKRRNES